MPVFNNRDRFGKTQRRFKPKMEEFKLREFEVPKQDNSMSVYALRQAKKRLVNKSLGKGFDIPGGITWKDICENILKDGTSPATLARVARGCLHSTNGWEVKILD